MEPYFADSVDDLLSPAEIGKISGYEFILGMLEGRHPAPPIARTLDFRLTEVEEGRVVFTGSPKFPHFNPIGSVHGGWFGTLLDSCMACAVQTRLPVGKGYTTLEFKVNILRPAFESTGPLRAIGETIHVGRRTATADGKIVDQNGKIYATGSTTCLVMEIAAG
ncbi:PaaI family thioesterase [Rhodobacteraceae bacterium NNCM2]|nr:PaaI family thioesterase [Coraliihabitans acroporae]